MDNSLEKIIISFAPLVDSATNLGLSENNKDLYFLMDTLVQQVKEAYPDIPCKNKCSMCCEKFGLPRVTAVEWRAIHKYLTKKMDSETRAKIVKHVLDNHLPQLEELMKEQKRIQTPHMQRISEDSVRPDFKCGYCPLLVEGSCTIYPVRPAICRSYGYFSIRVEGQSQLFTCRPAADKMMGLLKDRGVENWVLPVWDKFSEKVYEINRGQVVSTLPVWILSHLDENKEIKSEVNLNPDFDSIL